MKIPVKAWLPLVAALLPFLFVHSALRAQTCLEGDRFDHARVEAPSFSSQEKALYFSLESLEPPSRRAFFRFIPDNGEFHILAEEEFLKSAASADQPAVNVSNTDYEVKVCRKEEQTPSCWIVQRSGPFDSTVPSEDGRELALVRSDGNKNHVEIYSGPEGKRTAHFQTRGTPGVKAHLLGPSLLLVRCTAGPYCEGEVTDRKGRTIRKLEFPDKTPINVFDIYLSRVEGNRWLLVAPYDGVTLELDALTGKAVRKATFPAFEWEGGAPWYFRSGKATLLILRNQELDTTGKPSIDVILWNFLTGQRLLYSLRRCRGQ